MVTYKLSVKYVRIYQASSLPMTFNLHVPDADMQWQMCQSRQQLFHRYR